MANALVRIYSDFSTAQSAREQLLASGIPAGDVQLTVRDDEAGPVKGNFMVGNGGAASRGLSGFLGPKGGTEETIYGPDFQYPTQRGSYMLIVETTDSAHRDRASEIMNHFASIDINRS